MRQIQTIVLAAGSGSRFGGDKLIWRDQLVALTGDAGARALLTEQSDALIRIETDDPSIMRDVDRRGDLDESLHAVPAVASD